MNVSINFSSNWITVCSMNMVEPINLLSVRRSGIHIFVTSAVNKHGLSPTNPWPIVLVMHFAVPNDISQIFGFQNVLKIGVASRSEAPGPMILMCY